VSKGKLGCLIAAAAILLIGLIFGFSLVGRYNSLVSQNEAIDGAWAQVENVLQRRADLIPNLVETVKGYAAHETEIFENVTSALGRLLAIAENYPNLKANQNFMGLQDELSGAENRITTERRRYNEAVRSFNTTVKRFPNNLIAGYFGFAERVYFEAEEEAKEVPKVEF
jgi:LemA protein